MNPKNDWTYPLDDRNRFTPWEYGADKSFYFQVFGKIGTLTQFWHNIMDMS